MTIYEIFQIKNRLDTALKEIDKQAIIKMTFYNYDNACFPFYLKSETELYDALQLLNTVHTIDKCNEDDLFRKLNLVRVNKITFELNDFKGIDSNLKRLIVGICV